MDEPDDMIERVARALFRFSQEKAENVFLANSFDDVVPVMQDHYRAKARAAIEAMREPTAEMRYSGPSRVDSVLSWRDIGDKWKAMIDTALRKTDPK